LYSSARDICAALQKWLKRVCAAFDTNTPVGGNEHKFFVLNSKGYAHTSNHFLIFRVRPPKPLRTKMAQQQWFVADAMYVIPDLSPRQNSV
jgi:hypothetical protein